VKKKILSLVALFALSTLLTACGADATATPPPAPTNTTVVAAPTDTAAAMAAPTNTAATAASTATTASGTSGGQRPVVVSSKDFTEEFLLGEMYADMLESVGVPVTRKLNLGASDLAQAALLKGGANDGIDLYPEYTSTGLTVILKKDPIFDPPAVYTAVKQGYEDQFKLTWLNISPMNDTQAFVTTQDVSNSLGIKSIADMCAKADQIRVSVTSQFKDRPDAYPRLVQVYGACNFKEMKAMDFSLFYPTLLNKDVEVTQANSTDGPIAGDNLVLLSDPKNYGLPYNIAPVVRDDVLAMYPQIADALNKLAPMLTNDVISGLNWEVDGKKREYADVAKEFLQKQGLIK
jgi:osmoprotectant transport system substrate-binding protein